MAADSAPETIRRLLHEAGRTFADRAGVTLADRPAPLFQLMTLCVLLSARINSQVAVQAERELLKAGSRTPQALLESTWQQRVDALGRAHYRRYDESTATRLAEATTWLQQTYGGDLRKIAQAADGSIAAATRLIQQVPGIGPVGADIFLREVQAVWAWVRPYAGDRVLKSASALGLPGTAEQLAELVGSKDLSPISSALIDAAHDKSLRRKIAAG